MDNISQALKGNGVVSGCAVTEAVAPDKTVLVGTGSYISNGTTVTISSATSVDLSTLIDVTYPCKVIITAKSDGTLTATAGTPAVAIPAGNTGPETYTPTLPSIPSNEIVLAEVWLDANETTILNADITDRRLVVIDQDGDPFPQYILADGSTAVAAGSYIKDEDDMASDLDTALATQQSIKAYVDNHALSSKIVSTTYNGATGDQAVTGAGFTPKAAIVVAHLSSDTVDNSIGFADSSGAEACIYSYWNGSSAVLKYSGSSVSVVGQGGTAGYTSVVKSMDADGLTFTHTKGGAGAYTGTYSILFLR